MSSHFLELRARPKVNRQDASASECLLAWRRTQALRRTGIFCSAPRIIATCTKFHGARLPLGHGRASTATAASSAPAAIDALTLRHLVCPSRVANPRRTAKA